ncbi:Uncharacterized protein APZ42_012729, partial [Daphnia magna]
VALLATELTKFPSRLFRWLTFCCIDREIHRSCSSSPSPVHSRVHSSLGIPAHHLNTSIRTFIIPRKKNTPAAKVKKKMIRKGFRQEQYRFQHIKDLEPGYRDTASETTARLIAQRRPTDDMQAVIFPAPRGRDTDTPPQPPEALRAALVKSSQSRRKTGPWLVDFVSPPSPKKPRFYRPYSPRPVEQLPDPPTPPGV